MRQNYNDIIDILLTINKDEEISKNIAVSGSIVPYIIAGKESEEFHTDFYILVKEKKINTVRSKMKELSKEFEIDFVSDSTNYYRKDFGFKMKYQNTIVGFFPYSLIDKNLTIKTYSISNDEENKKIIYKVRMVPNISKNCVIKYARFTNEERLRIVSPEFILVDKELKEKQPGNPTKETVDLLEKICDETIVKMIRKSMINQDVVITSANLNIFNQRKNILLIGAVVIVIIFIILLLLVL